MSIYALDGSVTWLAPQFVLIGIWCYGATGMFILLETATVQT